MIALVIAAAVGALAYVVASSVDREGRGPRVAAPARGLPDPGRARPGDAGADQRARRRAAARGPHRHRATRFTPQGYGEKVAQKLVHGGQPAEPQRRQDPGAQAARHRVGDPLDPARVLVLELQAASMLLVGVRRALGRARSCTPTSLLNRKIEDRQNEISRKLPDILDLLVISVEAGLGFEQALDRTMHRGARRRCRTSSGACCTRSASVRPAPTPCAPWPSAATCPSCAAFILAMLQADTFGVSISRLLRSQADEMRIRRRLLRAGEGAEGAGQDAVPARVLHLPVDLRGHPRPRDDQHLARALTMTRDAHARAPGRVRDADDRRRRRTSGRAAHARARRRASAGSSPRSSACSAGRSGIAQAVRQLVLLAPAHRASTSSTTASRTTTCSRSPRRARSGSRSRGWPRSPTRRSTAASGAFGIRLFVGARRRRHRHARPTGSRCASCATACVACGLDRRRARAASTRVWSERPLLSACCSSWCCCGSSRCPTASSAVTRSWSCPVLMWLWANIHGTYPLGFAYLGLHLLGRWLDGSAAVGGPGAHAAASAR